MTKELRKAISIRSRVKNKYNKWPSRENILALQLIKKKMHKPNKGSQKAMKSLLKTNF